MMPQVGDAVILHVFDDEWPALQDYLPPHASGKVTRTDPGDQTVLVEWSTGHVLWAPLHALEERDLLPDLDDLEDLERWLES